MYAHAEVVKRYANARVLHHTGHTCKKSLQMTTPDRGILGRTPDIVAEKKRGWELKGLGYLEC